MARRPRLSAEPVVLETRVVTGTGGGPDKTILNSPRYLWSAGYRTICAYMHPPGEPGFETLREKAAVAQAPLVSIPDRGPWDWRVVTQYLALCRRERVAIWHGHDYKSNALGLLIRRFWPMHLVTTVHGWGVQIRRASIYYRVDEMCLPRYDAVICVSEDLHDRALKLGVPQHRCTLIENAIDIGEYSRPPTNGQPGSNGAGRIVIGAVGRLSPEKGFDVLIRAAHQLIKNGYDLEVVIAGAGDSEASLRALIAELNVTNRVRLLGFRSDTRSLYESMDIYVLSSIREGLPNVVLEAMAMEVPVVATKIAGVPRIIRDGVNGLLISPGSVEQTAAALRRLIDNPDQRARFAAAGRQTVVENYSFANRMQRIRVIYDKLLGRVESQSQTSRFEIATLR